LRRVDDQPVGRNARDEEIGKILIAPAEHGIAGAELEARDCGIGGADAEVDQRRQVFLRIAIDGERVWHRREQPVSAIGYGAKRPPATARHGDGEFGLSEQVEQVAGRTRKPDLDDVVGHRADAFDARHLVTQAIAAVGGDPSREDPRDLATGDRIAVGPARRRQPKDVGPAVIGHRPGFGQPLFDAAIGTVADKALGERRQKEAVGIVERLPRRVGDPQRSADQRDARRAVVVRNAAPGGRQCGKTGHQKGDSKADEGHRSGDTRSLARWH